MGVVVEVGASHRLKKLSKKMANCRQHERNKKYGEKRRGELVGDVGGMMNEWGFVGDDDYGVIRRV